MSLLPNDDGDDNYNRSSKGNDNSYSESVNNSDDKGYPRDDDNKTGSSDINCQLIIVMVVVMMIMVVVITINRLTKEPNHASSKLQ